MDDDPPVSLLSALRAELADYEKTREEFAARRGIDPDYRQLILAAWSYAIGVKRGQVAAEEGRGVLGQTSDSYLLRVALDNNSQNSIADVIDYKVLPGCIQTTEYHRLFVNHPPNGILVNNMCNHLSPMLQPSFYDLTGGRGVTFIMPAFVSNDPSDNRFVNRKNTREPSFAIHTRSPHFTYLPNLVPIQFSRKPCLQIDVSRLNIPVTTLSIAISHIIGRRTKPQMSGVTAGRIITGVADVHPGRYRTIRQLIRNAMGIKNLAIHDYASVPSRVTTASPHPARIISATSINARPKRISGVASPIWHVSSPFLYNSRHPRRPPRLARVGLPELLGKSQAASSSSGSQFPNLSSSRALIASLTNCASMLLTERFSWSAKRRTASSVSTGITSWNRPRPPFGPRRLGSSLISKPPISVSLIRSIAEPCKTVNNKCVILRNKCLTLHHKCVIIQSRKRSSKKRK